MERIRWIDFLRGISMILILVFHTEVYYKEYNVTPYFIYTTNAIILFYFISGYMFYRPESFSLKKKTISIVKSLLLPYFIFTTLIAIPKVLLRQENIDWIDTILNIISGRASWFIAALIVGELFFAILLTKTRGKTKWLSTNAIACFIIYYVIPFNQHNYWQWQDALLAVPFLSAGYIYHQYEKHLNTINKPLYSFILLLILIIIKIYEYHVDLPMRNIAIENIPLFLADTFIWLLFIISIIRYIPRCKMIEWTGKHSIVYYFLAGGCPLLISMIMNNIEFNYDGYLYHYLIALISVYALSTWLTWLIFKYIPFITGKNYNMLPLTLFILLLFNIFPATSQTVSQLPIIKISGEFGYEYQEGTFLLIMPDGSTSETLTGKIKWRGGSTNTEGKNKRNYKIKFTEDHSFFGLRNDNNWILDAGQADLFRLRNRIATELWNDFATKPYYINEEPKALSGVRGEVVEVYLNDEYKGIYCFTECLDRKQMKLKKYDKDGTIHGVLWKSTGYGSSGFSMVPDEFDNSQPMMDVFEAKYPEPGDDLQETDYSILWNAINFVVNSTDEEFCQHVNEYFDIPVIIDYYLFVNVLSAIDNEGKNMYWAVYDQQKNKKITPAVWDLDLTVGSKYLDYYFDGFSSPEFGELNVLNIITRLKINNVDNFNEKVLERYHSLRKTFFSDEKLINRYKKYYDILKLSGATEREENRWSGDSDINYLTIDYDYEIKYISDWITRHMQFLDREVFPTSTSVNTINIKHKENSFYNFNGLLINKNSPFMNRLFISNRKKYVVK